MFLSRNAQQKIDGKYSYTKYDEQGRISEVGELTSTDSLNMLVVQLDSLSFPAVDNYVLSDRTLTYFDFADTTLRSQFAQENLRSRVSYVEVITNDTVQTHYSYDIHGNVKSLLQQLPGLQPKRTDYAYDLVSGKVNYVMYQYGEHDQFIHRYAYDADNRIIDC